jgi:HD-GYP domain-containing protein (c-di-GMP phosphodiesterase class II)
MKSYSIRISGVVMMNKSDIVTGMIDKKMYTVKSVKDLIPGDIVLHPVYRTDGLLLVNIYTVLNSSLIYHIKIHLKEDIKVIVVESREEFEKFIEDNVYLDSVFLKTIKETVQSMEKLFNIPLALSSFLDERVQLNEDEEAEQGLNNFIQAKQDKNMIKKMLSFPLWKSFEEIFESETLKSRAKNVKTILIKKILMEHSVLDIIRKINEYDNRLFIHSVNTSCISILIGLTIELTDDEIINLAITAMFCNVGFIMLDKSEFKNFLENHENITTVNSHIKKSVEILSASKFCRNKSIIYGVLDHHEKYNGKGMPMKKSEENISLFGRIIAIAMKYDELTAGFDTGGAINVRKAIIKILDNIDYEFDPNLLRIFINRTSIYKIGHVINLENGEKGTIIGFSDYLNYPQRPIVQLKDGYIIDYSKIKL